MCRIFVIQVVLIYRGYLFFSVEECIWFHRVVAEVGYIIMRGSPRLRYQLPRPRDETKILMHYST